MLSLSNTVIPSTVNWALPIHVSNLVANYEKTTLCQELDPCIFVTKYFYQVPNVTRVVMILQLKCTVGHLDVFNHRLN